MKLDTQDGCESYTPERWQLLVKRGFDLLISICMFVVLFPTYLIIAILIKLDSRGPVIYRDKRLCKSGNTFDCLKFRTMVLGNEAILKAYLKDNPIARQHWSIIRKLPNDPRVTRIGRILRKTGFDEIPQFFNIIRGEMSLIGPRPFIMKEWPDLERHAVVIFSVRPGLIGTWLANGRNENTFSERIQLELDYVRGWSLKTDLLIFCKCIIPIFTERGAQ